MARGGVSFELERFGWTAEGSRLEVAGRWRGSRPRRLGPAILAVEGNGRRRLAPALVTGEAQASPDPLLWRAEYRWDGGAVGVFELEVGPSLVIELPPPEGPAPAGRPAPDDPQSDELAALRRQVEADQGEIERLHAELVELRRASFDVEQTRNFLKAAQATADAERKAVRVAREEAAARREAGEAGPAKSPVEEVQEQMVALRSEVARVRDQADVERREAETAREALVMARAAAGAAREEQEEGERERAAALEALAERERERDALAEALAERERERDALAADLAERDRERDALAGDLAERDRERDALAADPAERHPTTDEARELRDRLPTADLPDGLPSPEAGEVRAAYAASARDPAGSEPPTLSLDDSAEDDVTDTLVLESPRRRPPVHQFRERVIVVPQRTPPATRRFAERPPRESPALRAIAGVLLLLLAIVLVAVLVIVA